MAEGGTLSGDEDQEGEEEAAEGGAAGAQNSRESLCSSATC